MAEDLVIYQVTSQLLTTKTVSYYILPLVHIGAWIFWIRLESEAYGETHLVLFTKANS